MRSVAQLERSLRALDTDYIDVYQFHSGSDEVFGQDAAWEALGAQMQAGKVRHLGISLGSNANVHQTDRATAVEASVVQLVYSRLDPEPELEVLASCERHDLGVLAREALPEACCPASMPPAPDSQILPMPGLGVLRNGCSSASPMCTSP
ncbi:aldo/keto reductase [Sinomonas sp. ASV486]|uniref:aldo/keto reductase n=1 Tax=Sinomonas sp. ASV486 TaxID=3051170 RepID=UPI0027DCA55D|nr:aldo/keto reductase [Sinomonas sp. ASV486]MDQ4489809.1 aldo/keto reductase [Sinomonas sp. ASV486]